MNIEGLLTTLMGNLGTNVPDLSLIILLGFLLVFFAIEVRLGLLLTFVLSGALFAAYYSLGWNVHHILLFFFLAFALLVLSLYIQSQKRGAMV